MTSLINVPGKVAILEVTFINKDLGVSSDWRFQSGKGVYEEHEGEEHEQLGEVEGREFPAESLPAVSDLRRLVLRSVRVFAK